MIGRLEISNPNSFVAPSDQTWCILMTAEQTQGEKSGPAAFISYSRKDLDFANRLETALKERRAAGADRLADRGPHLPDPSPDPLWCIAAMTPLAPYRFCCRSPPPDHGFTTRPRRFS
jgi:hypothetical protein